MSRVVFGAILGLSKIAKPVSVMLQSGFAKQLVEADILLFIEAERILITRCFRLLSSFLVGIHSFRLKGVRLGRTPPGLAERVPLSDKGTPRRCLATTKIRAGNFFCENFEKPPKRLPERSFPCAILQPSGAGTSPRCGLVRS